MIYLRIGVTKTTELLLNRLSGKKTVLSYLKLETGEKRIFFFKSAVSVRDNDGKSFEQFQKIVEFLKKFSHKPTSK